MATAQKEQGLKKKKKRPSGKAAYKPEECFEQNWDSGFFWKFTYQQLQMRLMDFQVISEQKLLPLEYKKVSFVLTF